MGQTFGYKPWSDFGPLGRNRALPSCHSSLYQQRDEEPSSLERGGRAQQQETIREKEGGIERRKQIKQTREAVLQCILIREKKGGKYYTSYSLKNHQRGEKMSELNLR